VSESELNDKSLHDNSAVCSSFSPTVSVRVRRGREWWARGGGEGGEGGIFFQLLTGTSRN